MRRAIQQMVFPNKTFYWPRHIAIAFILLTFINLLVIFAPNILGIFGVIGRLSGQVSCLYWIVILYLNDAKSTVMFDFAFVYFTGATSAPCLIFIFPAVFYIRIVPKEEEPSFSVPKILVSVLCCDVIDQMLWASTPVVSLSLSLSVFQAACFAGIGFLFMIMSLSFIIIDWTSGTSNASSGH